MDGRKSRISRYDLTRRVGFNPVPNTIVLRIDDRLRRRTLPCSNLWNRKKHGWFPYGGITRPVYLQWGLPLYVAQAFVRTTAQDGSVSAELFVEHLGSAGDTPVRPYRLRAWIEDDTGTLCEWAEATIPPERTSVLLSCRLHDARLWSPKQAGNRYRFFTELTSPEGEAERRGYDFAFKTYEARARRFFLNGEDRYLRGMNRHEDHPVFGPVYNEEVIRQDIALMQELEVDFVRSGHYPNDVRILKQFEDAGIMLVEEIPVYQLDTLQLASRKLRRLSREALEGMIVRDFNRPAIVMWSVANEIRTQAPAASGFVRMLYEKAREMDPSRPVMLARATFPPWVEKALGWMLKRFRSTRASCAAESMSLPFSRSSLASGCAS